MIDAWYCGFAAILDFTREEVALLKSEVTKYALEQLRRELATSEEHASAHMHYPYASSRYVKEADKHKAKAARKLQDQHFFVKRRGYLNVTKRPSMFRAAVFDIVPKSEWTTKQNPAAGVAVAAKLVNRIDNPVAFFRGTSVWDVAALAMTTRKSTVA